MKFYLGFITLVAMLVALVVVEKRASTRNAPRVSAEAYRRIVVLAETEPECRTDLFRYASTECVAYDAGRRMVTVKCSADLDGPVTCRTRVK